MAHFEEMVVMVTVKCRLFCCLINQWENEEINQNPDTEIPLVWLVREQLANHLAKVVNASYISDSEMQGDQVD